MNRTILIVICDFLLVSLLAFSTVDINKVADEGVERQVKVDIATNQIDSRQDLGNVMRLALQDERKKRDALVAELVNTRDSVSKQSALLSEREKQLAVYQQELRAKEQQSQKLEQQQRNLQQQYAAAQTNLQALTLQQKNLQEQYAFAQTNLQALTQQQRGLEQQYAAAQTNIQNLNQQLQNSSGEALLSKEKLAEMEAEVRKKMEQAAALQQQIAQLAKSNQIAATEKQLLSSRLQVAEAEKRSAAEQAAFMREEVKVEREEKAKLAEGVKALATKSGELAQEIRGNRALAPNTIFNEFSTNRVKARFYASRSTLLGIDSNRNKDTETILVTDGIRTFAMCHVQDTPLVLWAPGIDWEGLTGTLSRPPALFPIQMLSFNRYDPRVVFLPVSDAQALQLGCKVYRLAADPFRFQDAVVVGARDGYYGECKFQIDLSTPEYLKMDHSSLKGLFGKFNPSSGDLAFSKNGELIGVMANNTYCLLIRDFSPMASFRFSQDVRAQRTGETLSQLSMYVRGMPAKLQ